LGKSLNVPIWRLLGGAARRKIRLYVHVSGRTRQAIAEKVQAAKQERFTAVRSGLAFLQGRVVKRPWDLNLAVALVEAMRQAAGDDMDIMDDAHGMLTPTMALEFAKAIEKYRLLMLEDPVQPDDIEGLRWIGHHTTVPLGIGESLHGKTAFRPIVFERLASYVRPDVILAGGLTECRKIAAMAEANFIDVALHVAPSAVSNLAAAHFAAATTNCVIVENTRRPLKSSAREDLFMGGDISIQDGYAMLPDKPGLGCDLDERVAAKIPPRTNDPPRLEYDDGSVSDW
jgi:galactonate dehydratase